MLYVQESFVAITNLKVAPSDEFVHLFYFVFYYIKVIIKDVHYQALSLFLLHNVHANYFINF